MNKFIKSAIISAMLATTALPLTVSAEEDPIEVYLQGSKIDFEVDPVSVNGVTMVQFRPLFEKLGFNITWDSKTKKITAKNDNNVIIEMTLGSKSAAVNRVTKQLEVPAELIDGNTMVPLRFVGESSGKVVSWNGAARTVDITKGYEKYASYIPYAGDSFVDIDSVSRYSNLTNANTNVYEKDGYTYVMWMKDDTFNSKPVTNFYVSVAKDGKWISRNNLMSHQEKDTAAGKVTVFYESGSYYWRDSTGLRRITPTTSGYSNEEYVFKRGYSSSETETIFPIITKSGVGVILTRSYTANVSYAGSSTTQSYTYLYTPEGDQSYEVKDAHGMLKNLPVTTDLLFDESSRSILIFTDASYKRLNIETGDINYDYQGNDEVIRPSKTAIAGGTRFYTDGIMGFLYKEPNETTFRFSKLNSDFTFSEGIQTAIKFGEAENHSISFDGSDIRIWNIKTYERKPSIELNTYSRK